MSAPNPDKLPIDRACYWLDLHRREPRLTLRGARRADVVIVGAGYTGLWTAIHLLGLEPSLEIVIVDQGRVAYGGSGRNAGILSDTIDHSHALAIAHFGVEEAARLATLGRANVAEMTSLLEARGIDCHLERTGVITAALSDEHMQQLEESLACARSVGVTDWRLLGRDEMRAEIHSARYHGGLFNPAGAVLDPVRLADGLADEATRLGATLFEGSPVVALEHEDGAVRVRTDGGEVRAQTCVLATSAYTHLLLPRTTFRFMPLYDYVRVSEPLTPAQHEAIGWRGRQGVNDARSFFNYYRLTADGRILWGTSEAAYYSPNRVGPAYDHSERHYAELRTSLDEHFPELRDLALPYAWGGAICATTRFTPFFGKAMGGRVVYGLGFTGHGIGTTHLAGRVLAHLATHRHSPLLDLRLVRQMPFPYPPEPLRSWAVGLVTRALRRVDAGQSPGALLRMLDALGIGLSS